MAFTANPAHAGFEWVAPSSNGVYQQPSVVVAPPPSPLPSVSSATAAPEIISPVIITGNTSASSSASMVPSSMVTISSAPMASAPVVMPKKPDLAAEAISVAPTQAASAGEGIVQGFGNQVPLPLALRQILPIGYSFSIDPSVSMDILVSYKGGKSWRETLRDMLSPAGLAAREQGTQISVVAVAAPIVAMQNPHNVMMPPPATASSTMHYLPAPAAEMPVISVNPADGWTAQRGDSLRKVLTDWCRKANVELQWQAEYDYPIEGSAHFSNSFEDATRNLLAGFENARPQPIGELHTNAGAGQMVLVIQTRGNSYN